MSYDNKKNNKNDLKKKKSFGTKKNIGQGSVRPAVKAKSAETVPGKALPVKVGGFTSSGERTLLRPGTLLGPMPAVMVTCGSHDAPNVVTVAWTGIVCTKPPMLYISLRPERHSHKLISESGEFVVNLVPSSLKLACDWCGMYSGRDHDKFAECPQTITAIPSEKVSCPTLAQSPLALECKVKSVTPLGSHDMFLASVEAVTVDSALLDANGRLDLGRASLLAFAHGEYFACGDKAADFGFSVRKR